MIRGWLAAVALALCVVATAGAADAVGSVTVEGNRFYRDGAPWVAEGVTLVGLVSPAGLVANKATYAAARKSFGPGMLGQAKRFGADLVRFQVSQTGLDPKSKGYDAHYRDEVASAVTLARKSGLNVIVSMQWQGVSGKREAGMPSAATLRAWNAILGGFAKDKGVLLEIFNEPELRGIRPNDWAEWQDSMQPLIDGLRAAGSQNVLLVGGAQFARSFIGAPSLSDPLGELGYAVHPYLGEHNQTRGQWEKKFGAFARKHPVMATEFNSSAGGNYCRAELPEQTEALLDYLHEKRIGLVAWALDMPNLMNPDGSYSRLDNLICGQRRAGGQGGAGEMIHEYFEAN